MTHHKANLSMLMDLREEKKKKKDFGPNINFLKKVCVKVQSIRWSNGISCGNLQLSDRMLLVDYYSSVGIGHAILVFANVALFWWREVIFLPAFVAEGAGNMAVCLFC